MCRRASRPSARSLARPAESAATVAAPMTTERRSCQGASKTAGRALGGQADSAVGVSEGESHSAVRPGEHGSARYPDRPGCGGGSGAPCAIGLGVLGAGPAGLCLRAEDLQNLRRPADRPCPVGCVRGVKGRVLGEGTVGQALPLVPYAALAGHIRGEDVDPAVGRQGGHQAVLHPAAALVGPGGGPVVTGLLREGADPTAEVPDELRQRPVLIGRHHWRAGQRAIVRARVAERCPRPRHRPQRPARP